VILGLHVKRNRLALPKPDSRTPLSKGQGQSRHDLKVGTGLRTTEPDSPDP